MWGDMPGLHVQTESTSQITKMTETLRGAENSLESQPSFPNPGIVHFSPEELLNYFPLIRP